MSLQRKLVLLFVLADAVLAVVLAVALMRPAPVQDTHSHKRDELASFVGATEEMTEEEQQEKYDQALGKALKRISIHSESEAVDGEIYLYFNNAENSPCTVSMEIIIPETGETIARMGLVDPGWHVDKIPLLVSLEKGTYQCIARCSFYTGKNEVLMGTAAKMMLLTVK